MIVVVALVAPTAQAASEVRLAPGTRVRVAGHDLVPRRLIGSLRSMAQDSLILVPDGSGEALAIPKAAVASFEISRGRGAGRGKKALVGFLVGATAGCFAVRVLAGKVENPDPGYGVALLAGFGAGGLIGTTTGLILARGEQWKRVDLAGVRVALATSPGGSPGLAVSVGF